ncbi:Cell division suppressor protein YneA [compost metagenome]
MLTCTIAVRAFELNDEPEPETATEAVIIQSGDTLWQIAAHYKPEGWDTRAFIQAIQIVNEMDNSVIRAGEIILIPTLE